MLTGITLASCAVDAQDRYLAALSGVAFLETKAGIQVVAASAGERALTCFTFGDALTELDFFRLSAHAGLHDLVTTKTDLSVWGSAVSVDEYIFAQTGAQNLAVVAALPKSHAALQDCPQYVVPQHSFARRVGAECSKDRGRGYFFRGRCYCAANLTNVRVIAESSSISVFEIAEDEPILTEY